MIHRLERIAAIGGFVIVMIASLIMSGRIVVRTAGMALAARFETPHSDQWDLIPFIKAAFDGTGSFRLFWSQHNEHRIPLFLLLDVIDARYFHGTGQFLLLVNWAMVLGTVTVLALMAWQVPTLRWREKILGLAVIVGCAFSSAQIENLALPIGNTNLGVYLFGAATFAGIAYAGRPGRSGWCWAAPALAALLGTVSLASGIIIWPIAWVMALAIGASRRALAGWGLFGAGVIAAYFYEYASPDALGSAPTVGRTELFIDFLLLYFGSPLANLGLAKSAAAGIAVLLLFAGTIFVLLSHPQGRHRALVALMATGIFILGTGCLTAAGRLVLGAAAAQASRYTTPVLVLWAVSLLLLLSLPLARGFGSMPVRALQALLPVFTLFCLMRVEPFGEWVIPTAFEIRQTGVAVALDVRDPPREFLGGVTPERVAWYRPTLSLHELSMFHVARGLRLGENLADHYALTPAADCLGSVDEVAEVQSPRAAARIRGWAWDRRARRVPPYMLFTDRAGLIVGWGETGAARPDVPSVFPETGRSRPGFGGYARVAPGDPVRVFALSQDRRSACPINPPG